MSFFLSEEQQNKIDEWIDSQNKECIDRLINDPIYPESETLLENRKRGYEIPPHNPDHGYYSISFTPTPFGNRIYAHHHITNRSTKIFDMDDVKMSTDSQLFEEDVAEMPSEVNVEVIETSN